MVNMAENAPTCWDSFAEKEAFKNNPSAYLEMYLFSAL